KRAATANKVGISLVIGRDDMSANRQIGDRECGHAAAIDRHGTQGGAGGLIHEDYISGRRTKPRGGGGHRGGEGYFLPEHRGGRRGGNGRRGGSTDAMLNTVGTGIEPDISTVGHHNRV